MIVRLGKEIDNFEFVYYWVYKVSLLVINCECDVEKKSYLIFVKKRYVNSRFGWLFILENSFYKDFE